MKEMHLIIMQYSITGFVISLAISCSVHMFSKIPTIMSFGKGTVKWLNLKWFGKEAVVSRSRVKTCGLLKIVMSVQVAYKSSQHKLEIVQISEKSKSTCAVLQMEHTGAKWLMG